MEEHLRRYILLPARSLRGASDLLSSEAANFLNLLSTDLFMSTHTGAADLVNSSGCEVSDSPDIQVVDSISPTGAKLVEVTPLGIKQLKTAHPGLQIVPIYNYTPAVNPRVQVVSEIVPFSDRVRLPTRFFIVDANTSAPVPDAQVVALTNHVSGAGATGTTNSDGEAFLYLRSTALERLYVYPRSGYWSLMKTDLTISDEVQLSLVPISLDFQDGLRRCYPPAQLTDGAGVKVAVVDTGIAPHPDLVVARGFNAIHGESAYDYGDNGEGHGTHVAGIIAARGSHPTGIRGLAPGVELRSYRCFGKKAGSAQNWAIIKSIHQAIVDDCDIINLSLGGGSEEAAVRTAIRSARQHGCVVICAAGNGHRSPVSFPASEPLAMAISALGVEGSYPPETEQWSHIERPPNCPDSQRYIPGFSNIGPQISLVAPGDGIISTFPGGYAVMDGTSMACPVVSARAAVMLANDPKLRDLPRNINRSEALVTKLLRAARPLGFGPEFEGNGMLP